MHKLLAAALLYLSCLTLHAQTGNDTSYNAGYNKKIAASGDLYYGPEHTGYAYKMIGTPYFESNEWIRGSVTYNNVEYKDVSLKYDMITDELIILHPNNFFALTLMSERVQSFTLGQQEFLYVPKANKLGLKQSGFYQLVVSGKLSVLVKRNKVIEEKTLSSEVERTVVTKEQFYVVKSGIATNITGEDSVMGLLGEHTRQVRSFLRSKEIKFRKQKELALFEIATYYNQLAK